MKLENSLFSFLDPIDSSLIGFGGPVVIILLFLLLNQNNIRNQMSFSGVLVVIIPVYLVSLGTGIAVDELFGIGDRMSAITSGVIAPLLYCFLLHLLLIRLGKLKQGDSLSDHLIE